MIKKVNNVFEEKCNIIRKIYIKFFKHNVFNNDEINWYSKILKILNDMDTKGRYLK